MDKLIALKPKDAHLYKLSGRLAYNTSDTERAAGQFRKAIELEPQNAPYKVEYANILFGQGKKGEAKALYEELITRDPNFKSAWEQYITHYSNNEEYDTALAVAKRGIKQFPRDSDFHFMLATVYDRMGNTREALPFYFKSLEFEPMESSIAAERILQITGKRPPPELERLTTDRMSFETEGQVMYVTAYLNGKKGRFLLDTGASFCVLFNDKVNHYGLNPASTMIEADTAGGTIQAPVGYGSIQLGKYTRNPVLIATIPPPKRMNADGIIGMNFLQEFRFEIDQASRTLTLRW